MISLIDLIVQGVLASPRSRLLLSTTSTRTARIFESHKRWDEISRWVVLPDKDDQRALHEWIYRLKAGQPVDD